MNDNVNKEIVEILIDDIVPNRFQPRLTFDMEALNELSLSIKEHGIIQPLIVRKLQDKYEIIAGERRYKAASLAGLNKVPCIIMNLDDNESAEVAVIENIQRKQMTPLEEAKTFKKILEKGYITQDELAKKIGISQSSIANKLRLLNLDETVQDAILNEKISERHARSLLKIENNIEQRNMLKEIIDKRLTVRQLDEIIKEKYGTTEIPDNAPSISFNSTNPIFKNTGGTEMVMSDMNNNMNNSENKNIEFNNQGKRMSMPEVNLPGSNVSGFNQQSNIMRNNMQPPMQSNMQPISNMTTEPKPANPIFMQENNNNTEPVQQEPQQNIENQNPIFTNVQPPMQNQFITPQEDEIKPIQPIPSQNFNNNEININPIFKQGMQEATTEPKITLDSIINPQVLEKEENTLETPMEESNVRIISNPTENILMNNNTMSVNVDDIKNNAEDIIKEQPQADMNALMANNDGTPTNKFLININSQNDNQLSPRVEKTKQILEQSINELKMEGIYLEKEEKDLGNVYEVILKINK